MLGERVRYDGEHKMSFQVTQLERYCRLTPICPEVEAQLGVPRPPVQLVATPSIRALGVEQRHLDVTEPLAAASDRLAATHRYWCGAVLKARSPSCGAGTTPVHNKDRQPTHSGDGLFVTALKQHCPWLALINEEQIQQKQSRDTFLLQVFLLYDRCLSPEADIKAFLNHHQTVLQDLKEETLQLLQHSLKTYTLELNRP